MLTLSRKLWVAGLLAICLFFAQPVLAQSPVKLFGTGADGRAIPIRVASDGTLQMVLGVSGFEFEGTTVDDFETTLEAVDPTADRTIQLPDASGILALLVAQTFTGHQTFAADVNIGAAGVKLTADGDGALTFLGMGNGTDENLILNLDDTANEATFSSGTGVVTANFSGMDLLVNGIRVGRGTGAVASNVVVGTTALSSNTTGSENVAIGSGALNANIDGTYNIAIGYGALFLSTDGTSNVAVGPNALNSSLSADFNTAVGSGALINITTGEYNTAIGGTAGKFIAGGVVANATSGTSVYLGASTMASADGNANEIVVGYNAVGAGSNKAVIGSIAVTDVYLGSATGAASLHAGGGTFGLIATQDVIAFLPVTDNDRFTGTITVADLAGDRTYTLPLTGGTFAMTGDKLSAFAATSSSELLGVLSDETGTGSAVFDTAPSFASTVRIGTAATYDGILISPNAHGGTQFDGTLTSPDLQGSRTWVLPDVTGYIATTGAGDPRITAGAGTGITVNEAAAVRRTVYKVTVAAAQFDAAAVTHDVTIATLPAKTRLVGVYANLTTTFACTAVCTTATLSMTAGTAAAGTEILASFDIDAATGVFGDADAELGSVINAAARIQDAYLSWAGTIISVRLTSGTGNLGDGAGATNLSQGSVTFFLLCEVLP